MTELVMIALIQGGFGVLILILGSRINRKVKAAGIDAKAARSQVENDHDTNLRVEGDDRHKENSRKLDTILEEIATLRSSVRRLWERQDNHGDQIHALELTQPRSRSEPPGKHRMETRQ